MTETCKISGKILYPWVGYSDCKAFIAKSLHEYSELISSSSGMVDVQACD